MATLPDPQRSTLQTIGSLVGFCFAQLFSEARSLARMKFLAFASFLTFVGLGFAVRLSGIAGSWHERVVEIVLAGPDIVQTISALLALVFILVTNLYSRYRRQEYEEWLIRVAQDPSTPPEFKMAILEKFRGRP